MKRLVVRFPQLTPALIALLAAAALLVLVPKSRGITLSTAEASGPDELAASASERSAVIVGPDARGNLTAPALPAVPQATANALEPVDVYLNSSGSLVLSQLPGFSTTLNGKFASVSHTRQITLYTLDPQLQALAADLVRHADAPHIAIIAMDPKTGRILALAQKSISIPNPVLHTGFPAASLFKIVTSAATLEHTNLQPDSVIKFRGGTYVLERWNYIPDARRDRKFMTMREALAKSCNAVFGRIAFTHLNPDLLRQYSRSFGFGQPMKFERPVPISQAEIPTDSYEMSRTAAGFGEVTLSPIHAVTFMSGIANEGMMPQPILVDRVYSSTGSVLYQAKPESVQRMVQATTAHVLLDMMESTTTEGTSRKDFMARNRPVLGDIEVAAKTGTLKGTNPAGLNHWFVAAAPKQNPKIALAIISIDPRSSKGHPARLGRLLIEKYLLKTPLTSAEIARATKGPVTVATHRDRRDITVQRRKHHKKITKSSH